MRKFLFFTLALIFTAASAWAQTNYFVATTGNDGNNGSEESPWLTIQHAVNEALVGATINVAEGIYEEDVIFPVGKHGITLISTVKHGATIKGKLNADAVDVYNTTIDGFIIDGTVLENQWIEIFTVSGYDVTIRNNKVFAIKEGGVAGTRVDSDKALIENNEFERALGITTVENADIQIIDNKVTWAWGSAIWISGRWWLHPVPPLTGAAFVIEGNTVENHSQEPGSNSTHFSTSNAVDPPASINEVSGDDPMVAAIFDDNPNISSIKFDWNGKRYSRSIHNVTQNIYHAPDETIQDAIDAAAPDDVIQVAAGVFNEHVTINKGITLKGAQFGVAVAGRNGDETLIEGSFKLEAPDAEVTIDGFSFIANSGANELGVGGDYNTAIYGTVNKAVVQYNIINRASNEQGPWQGGGAIVHLTGNDLTVQHNFVEQWVNVSDSRAIHVTANGTALVNNNTTTSAISISTGENATVSITDNTVNGAWNEGIWFWPVDATAELTITGNNVSEYNTSESGAKELKVVSKPAKINEKTNTLEMLAALEEDNPLMDSFLLQWMGPVHNVTRDLFYTTIQAAIDAETTVAGDVIEVAAGIYNEQVNINKALTVKGPFYNTYGHDASRDGETGEAIIQFAPPQEADAPYASIVKIEADGVTFKGFTVRSSSSHFDYLFNGVAAINASNCIIENNIVHNNAYGIVVRTTEGEGNLANTNTIQGNLLFDNVCKDENGDIVFRVSSGGTKRVKGRAVVIEGHDAEPADHNKVFNNHISGSEDGVYIWKGNHTIVGEVGKGNIIEANLPFGVHLYRSTGGVIAFNTIRNNGVIGITGKGLEEIYEAQDSRNSAGIRVSGSVHYKIERNEIYNQPGTGGLQNKGIRLFIGGGITPVTDHPIKNNSIFGHNEQYEGISLPFQYAIDNREESNQEPYDIDANCNWWGTTVATDVAAKVSANIDVSTILLNNILDPNDDDYFCGAPIDKPVQNMNTLATYATIHDAIGSAGANHVIQVSPGEYVYEDEMIIVETEGLTITTDANNPATVINNQNGTQAVFDIRAEGVTLENFNLVRNNATSGGQVIAIRKSNIVVKNNKLSGSDNASPAITVDHGNPGAYDATVSNVRVEGNEIAGTYAFGILIRSDNGTGTLTDVYIEDNEIAITGIAVSVNATHSTNGLINANLVFAGNTFAKHGLQLYDLINEVDFDAFLSDNTFDGAVLITDNGEVVKEELAGTFFGDYRAIRGRIQPAINGASDGHVVEVAYGTYNENILIEKAISVKGAGIGESIIDGTDLTASALVRIANISSGEVLFDGFTIQNIPLNDAGNARFPAIISQCNESAKVTFSNNRVVGSGATETGVNQWGVYANNSTGEIIINNNTIDGIMNNSILIERAVGPVELGYNTINVPDYFAGNAIFSMSYKSGDDEWNVEGLHKYHNNTIRSDKTPQYWGIQGGIVVASAYGETYGQRTHGAYSNLLIKNNKIEDITPWYTLGKAIQLEIDGPNGGFDNVQITDNEIAASSVNTEPEHKSRGIRLLGDINNPIITGNVLTDLYYGVHIRGTFSEPLYPTGVIINENRFVNNHVAVNNETDNLADATCNWWDTAIFSEINDLITGNVTWSPYLLTADGPCGGFAPVANVTQGTYFTSIGAAVEAAAANNVIEVGEGTYNETFTIDVENLTLRAKAGHAVTIDGENTGNVVEITANGVTLKGFTVINGKEQKEDESFEKTAGIKLVDVSGVKLLENTVEDSWYGIWLLGASNTEIKNNIVLESATIGIYLDGANSTHNVVELNEVKNTGIERHQKPVAHGLRGDGAGIRIEADNNTIHDNIIQDNLGDGIRIQPVVGPDNTIEDLVITENLIHKNNQHGIRLGAGNNITITGNTITENGELNPGVRPHQRSGLYVYQSPATGDFGIHTVRNNIFAGNEPYGVNVGHDHDATDPGDITLDVKRNYWGAEDGPSTDEGFFSDYTITSLPKDGQGNPLFSDADGDGDAVSIDVVFGPYWMNEAKTQLSPITQDVAEGEDGDFDGTVINPSQNTTFTLSFFGSGIDGGIGKMSKGPFGTNRSEPLVGFYEISSGATVTADVTFPLENIDDTKNINRMYLLQREKDGPGPWVEHTPEQIKAINGTNVTWTVSFVAGVTYQFAFANGDQVEIAINRTSCNEFEVVVKPTATISNSWNGAFETDIADLQFTIKWPVTGAELTFEPFTEDSNPFIVEDYEDGGFNYATYFFEGYDTFEGKPWTGSEEYVVATFSHDQDGDEDGTFSIMEDDDAFASSTTVFFVDYFGGHLEDADYNIDATGVVYHPEGELSPVDVPLGKCPLTIGGTFTAKNKVYDGDETAEIVTNDLTLVTVIGSDFEHVTLDEPTVEFSDKNAAVGKTVSIISANISGDNAEKYELSIEGAPTALADITPRPLTANIIGNPSKVYDGNDEATLTPENYEFDEGGADEGLVAGESITINQTSGTYASADVGTRLITVILDNEVPTADFSAASGTSLLNYALPSEATGNGTITKKGLIVKAEDKEKLFDGEVFEGFTVTYDGFVAEEDESDLGGTLAFTGDAVTAVNIGEYTITPAGLTSGNYDIDFQNGTLEILPITIALKAFLQGSYDERDGFKNVYNTLRTEGQVPDVQPYDLAPHKEETPGAQAVDWVLVEFRDANDNSHVVGRAAGLLRTTGNFSVVVADNTVKAGEDYYIVINHRNHLPIMSKEPQTAPITERFDMTVPANLLDNSYFTQDEKAFLTAGDATGSGELAYSGPGNDRGRVLARMIAAGATSFNDTPMLDGYFFEDIRMNNQISYVEAPNDRGIILSNIGEFTGQDFLNLRWSSPVPGYGPAKSEYFNDGPVHILAEANAISIRSDEAIKDGLIDNIQFTLAWQTGDDIAEQAISNMKSTPFLLKPQGEAVDVNGISHLVMVSINPTFLPAYWAADEAIELITFTDDITGRLWIAQNEYTMDNNAMYYVSVWGSDHTGEIVTQDDPTGTGDITGEEGLMKLYPNPVNSGQLFVELHGAQGSQVDIAIYDIRGTLVKRITETNVSGTLNINVTGFAGGIYYLRATASTEVFTDKFIIAE